MIVEAITGKKKLLRVDNENSFWYIGVLDFGKKTLHLHHTLHCKYTSFHLDVQLTNQKYIFRGATYFPDICLDSN